ncbi:MAG: hypothetical protein ACFFG0_43630 [Candidatus Thorarchaeota archaeon]
MEKRSQVYLGIILIILGIIVFLLGYWCALLTVTFSELANCFLLTLIWAIPMICIGFGCIMRNISEK